MGPQGNHQGTPSFFRVCWDGDVRGLARVFDGIMAGLDPRCLSCMDRQVMAGVGSSQLANGENTGLLTT